MCFVNLILTVTMILLLRLTKDFFGIASLTSGRSLSLLQGTLSQLVRLSTYHSSCLPLYMVQFPCRTRLQDSVPDRVITPLVVLSYYLSSFSPYSLLVPSSEHHVQKHSVLFRNREIGVSMTVRVTNRGKHEVQVGGGKGSHETRPTAYRCSRGWKTEDQPKVVTLRVRLSTSLLSACISSSADEGSEGGTHNTDVFKEIYSGI